MIVLIIAYLVLSRGETSEQEKDFTKSDIFSQIVVPEPTFAEIYTVLAEAEYPGDLCCHLYTKEKIEGDIYVSCISELAENRQKVDTGDLNWKESIYYYTCGIKVG